MKLPAAWFVLRWLVRDTLRQSLASGVFWLLLGVNALCILFCLSVGYHGTKTQLDPDTNAGAIARFDREATYVFGAIRTSSNSFRGEHVQKLEFYIGGIGAQTIGLVLVLTFTAGFLPSFVDPNSALILLAKPMPRWFLFLGKYAGVLAFLAIHVTILVVGTWAALGIATGEWHADYLWNIPILLLHFAIYFSFSALLAVMTRNMTACVIGSVIFWLLCWAMNYGRHMLVAHDLPEFSAASRFLTEASYWILPKPADIAASTYNLLHASPLAASVPEFGTVQSKGAFHAGWSLASSFVFSLVMVALAGYELETADY